MLPRWHQITRAATAADRAVYSQLWPIRRNTDTGMLAVAAMEPRDTYRVVSHSTANRPQAIRATRQSSSSTSTPPERMPLPPRRPKNTGNIWPSSQPMPAISRPRVQSPTTQCIRYPPMRQARTVFPMSQTMTHRAYRAP